MSLDGRVWLTSLMRLSLSSSKRLKLFCCCCCCWCWCCCLLVGSMLIGTVLFSAWYLRTRKPLRDSHSASFSCANCQSSVAGAMMSGGEAVEGEDKRERPAQRRPGKCAWGDKCESAARQLVQRPSLVHRDEAQRCHPHPNQVGHLVARDLRRGPRRRSKREVVFVIH